MRYYPDQRLVSEMTTINREVLLPSEAIGSVIAVEGQAIDIREHVARGLIPARHYVLPAAEILRLRNTSRLQRTMEVKLNVPVSAGDVLAVNRNRRVTAPVDGVVVYVGEGRIIMQEMPEIINLEAGVRGKVVRTYPGRGVAIEAIGAVVQGVWGNGGSVISTLRMEPPGGVETIPPDELDNTYRNEVVVTRRPITPRVLEVMTGRIFAGLIAPSMDSSLLDQVLELNNRVMLTEGFGNIRMSQAILALLQEFDSYQVTLDTHTPQRWSSRRPELVINRSTDEPPPPVDWQISLRRGMRVRISRTPHSGVAGRILELLDTPVELENGLRVPGARVEIGPDEIVEVPLANLELAGR